MDGRRYRKRDRSYKEGQMMKERLEEQEEKWTEGRRDRMTDGCRDR